MEALPRMTWRRFLVLLRGLGPNSALVTIRAMRQMRGGLGPAGGVRVARTPEESARILRGFFGAGARKAT